MFPILRYKLISIGKISGTSQKFKSDNGSDDPVAANKLNIKTDVKCDLGPSHCYPAHFGVTGFPDKFRSHQDYIVDRFRHQSLPGNKIPIPA